VLATTLIASAIAGVGAASALTDPVASSANPQGSVSAVIDGSASIDATSPDPEGGPDWAVARFVNDDDRQCALVGRSLDGRFGRVDGDGSFVLTGIGPGGVCGDPSQELVHAIDIHPVAGSQDARTIFFGMSYSDEQLSVAAPDGSTGRPALGDRGGFLVVARGQYDISDWTVGFRTTP
jgi:hypothetical protein